MTTVLPIFSDQLPSTGAGVIFFQDDMTITLAADIAIQSIDDAGVVSTKANSGIVNDGMIYSANLTEYDAGKSSGVYLWGGSIVNNATGFIGGRTGIVCNGNPLTITNRGDIYGFNDSAIQLYTVSGTDVVKNFGQIIAAFIGIYAIGVTGNTGNHSISNSGVIRSAAYYGIAIDGSAATIQNLPGGLIQGPIASITSLNSGRVTLDNRGTIVGAIDFAATNQNDVVTNRGKIKGEVHLGSGNDTFAGAGGTSGKIFGDAGNDKLAGGNGKDILSGGGGRDFFIFNSIQQAGKGAARDEITDFNRAIDDRIDLRGIDAQTGVAGNNAFTFIGTAAFHRVQGELRCSGGIVQGDVNGDGIADFEIKVNLATLVAGDFFL